ncbi:glycosyltransferase family 9 protein [Duganella sp. Leaf126]|uniref:glycosyltransferase family 9 protein n=1 Tax=Duganella sp. Leaf126 TaxID=1736266 RepID=UPI0009EB6361|nr:glycosyltransferase family 9 protein [Duganella sp. Leaf126]
MKRTVCLIVSRNLGDAVIQSAFLEKLALSGYAEHYVAWVRPQVAFLFENIENCRVVCSQFPVGTTKNFGWKNAYQFMKAVRKLRRLGLTTSMDLIGDFRERFFARLIGAQKHEYIGWQDGHPFKQIIRNPFGSGVPSVVIPSSCPGVYESYGMFLAALTKGNQTSILSSVRGISGEKLKIGLHPFASKRCRMWPEENWRDLALQLVDNGHDVTLFGAGSERPTLERIFSPILPRVRIYTKSLSDFTNEVANLDIFVGLDSFGVHMAQRQGVKNVLINAGSDPTMWPPPNSILLAKSGGCEYYPCNNMTKCDGTDSEFICIRSIEPQRVLCALSKNVSS